MEERKKLTQMLKDFQAEQKELLAQAEQRLEVNSLFIVKNRFLFEKASDLLTEVF